MINEYDETEIFEKQAIFDYLVNQLRFDRKGMSVIGRAYIEDAIEYFDDVKEGLEEIPRKRMSHQKYLKEIFEAINGGETPTIELISKTIEKLGDAQEQLEQLAESPIDFYQTRGANELLDVCQKFRHVYDSKI